MKHIKFIPFVITIFLLASGSVNGASTVVSEGVAAITSNIQIKEYRKRAIENALQNIAFEREQALRELDQATSGDPVYGAGEAAGMGFGGGRTDPTDKS